jgi:prolipoprotein diacylglyceryltransferase
MLPYLSLGPLLLPLAPLTLFAGVWSASWLAEREAERLGLDAARVSNLIWTGLLAGVLGARLGYAALHLSAFRADPLSLFALSPEALSPEAGLAAGLLVAGAYLRKRLPLRPTLDALAPGLAVFLVALGVAHLLSGAAYGAPADLPWSIELWAERRHPAQVYEILAALAVLAVAWRTRASRTRASRSRASGSRASGSGAAPRAAGLSFLLVVALSAGARAFLEAFRGDSVLWPGGYRAAQILALVLLAATLWLMGRWAREAPEPAEQAA